MARRRAQQIGKPSQRVGTDDVALVRPDVPAALALGREDVEVIEPEIGHHLLELSLAHHGAHGLGRLQLGHDADRPLLEGVHVHQITAAHLAGLHLLARARIRPRITAEQVGDRHAKGREVLQRGVGRGVVDAARHKLLLEIGLKAQGADALDIAGSRTVRHPAQHVKDPGVVPGGASDGSGAGDGSIASDEADAEGDEQENGRQPACPHGAGRCCCRSCWRKRWRSSGGICCQRSRSCCRCSGVICCQRAKFWLTRSRCSGVIAS